MYVICTQIFVVLVSSTCFILNYKNCGNMENMRYMEKYIIKGRNIILYYTFLYKTCNNG